MTKGKWRVTCKDNLALISKCGFIYHTREIEASSRVDAINKMQESYPYGRYHSFKASKSALAKAGVEV
jgi:hypothetical protein